MDTNDDPPDETAAESLAEARCSCEGDAPSALQLAFENLREENQRLRDARASITRQLGPLPISAAVIAGLIAAFPGSRSGSPAQLALTSSALLLFVIMADLSVLYSGLKPYRELREAWEAANPQLAKAIYPSADPDSRARARWYGAMIALERDVRGDKGAQKIPQLELGTDDSLGVRRWRVIAFLLDLNGHLAPKQAMSLKEGFALERRGLFIVKGLFAAIVVLLIVARLT